MYYALFTTAMAGTNGPEVPFHRQSGDGRMTREGGRHTRSWPPSRPRPPVAARPSGALLPPGSISGSRPPPRPAPEAAPPGEAAPAEAASPASPLAAHGRICPRKVSGTSAEQRRQRREPGEAKRGERAGPAAAERRGQRAGERRRFPGAAGSGGVRVRARPGAGGLGPGPCPESLRAAAPHCAAPRSLRGPGAGPRRGAAAPGGGRRPGGTDTGTCPARARGEPLPTGIPLLVPFPLSSPLSPLLALR